MHGRTILLACLLAGLPQPGVGKLFILVSSSLSLASELILHLE